MLWFGVLALQLASTVEVLVVGLKMILAIWYNLKPGHSTLMIPVNGLTDSTCMQV